MSQGARPTLVVGFSYVTWEDSLRRGQNHTEDRFVQDVLNRPEFGHVVVAEPFRSGPVRATKRLAGHRSLPLSGTGGAVHSRFRPTRLRRDDPSDVRAVASAAARYSDGLLEHVRRHGLETADLILTNPLMAAYGEFAWARSVTFYATDDHSASDQFVDWKRALLHGFDLLQRRRRAVAAVAPAILERISPTGPSLLLPNGIDPEQWTTRNDPPAWMAELPGPVAIYAGAIDERLDIDLVRRIAIALSPGTVVLAGHVTDARVPAALHDLPNVRFAGNIPYGDVPAMVAGADLAILPHRVTALTQAMSPLKVYEALGAGIPVLATDLPPLRGVSARVITHSSAEDIREPLARALGLPPLSEAERRDFLNANAWRDRFTQLIKFATSPTPS